MFSSPLEPIDTRKSHTPLRRTDHAPPRHHTLHMPHLGLHHHRTILHRPAPFKFVLTPRSNSSLEFGGYDSHNVGAKNLGLSLRFHVNFSNNKNTRYKISREVARFKKYFPSFVGNHGHDQNQRTTITSIQRSSQWWISSTTDFPP